MPIQQVMIMANAILSGSSGKKSVIDSLTVRVADLTISFDRWNRWMLWGLGFAAIAAIWIGLTTRMTIVRSKQLTVAQGELDAAKEAELKLDLKDKEGKILGLQKEATDAKSAQQGVETELATQQSKAATAERELLEVKERVKRQQAPRWAFLGSLTKSMLGRPTGSFDVIFANENDEAMNTALWIESSLSGARWKILNHFRPYSEADVVARYLTRFMKDNPTHESLYARVGGWGATDITVLFSPADANADLVGFPRAGTAADALLNGLRECGFQPLPWQDSRFAAGTVRVVVGPKL